MSRRFCAVTRCYNMLFPADITPVTYNATNAIRSSLSLGDAGAMFSSSTSSTCSSSNSSSSSRCSSSISCGTSNSGSNNSRNNSSNGHSNHSTSASAEENTDADATYDEYPDFACLTRDQLTDAQCRLISHFTGHLTNALRAGETLSLLYSRNGPTDGNLVNLENEIRLLQETILEQNVREETYSKQICALQYFLVSELRSLQLREWLG